jgi:hypothetical protein
LILLVACGSPIKKRPPIQQQFLHPKLQNSAHNHYDPRCESTPLKKIPPIESLTIMANIFIEINTFDTTPSIFPAGISIQMAGGLKPS